MSEGTMDKRQEEFISRDICGETVICEAAGEYTLPDYQPEIRRLLHVRAAILPAGKYMGGAKAEFAGAVAHTVLYADGEGKLASVTLDSDYEFSVPLPDGGSYTAMADTMVESTVCRLSGPRKLSLRTRLCSLVHVMGEEGITPEIRGMGSDADEASIERLTLPSESMTLACGSSGEFTLSATHKLDSSATDARAVWAGGNVLVTECRAQAGGCLCRGEVWARALLAEGEGTPTVRREKIPFERFVEIEGVKESASCTAYGRLLMADVTILPGEGEESGTLGFDVSVEIEVCASDSRPCNPTRELYSTAYDMSCRYRTLTVARPLGATMGHYSVGGSRPRTECEAENAIAIVDTDGRLEITGVTVEHGKATVSGKLYTQVIFVAAGEGKDGTPAFASAEVPVPFRIETELRPPHGAKPHFDCHGELIAARARIEPNAIGVDAEIALTLRAYENEDIRVLESAEPDRSVTVDHTGNRIYVLYPKEGDTLFGVAARYHKSRAAIAAQNDLAEDALAVSHLTHSIDGIHHLLITDDN